MELKNKKILVGVSAGVVATGTVLAIALPLALHDKDNGEATAKFSKEIKDVISNAADSSAAQDGIKALFEQGNPDAEASANALGRYLFENKDKEFKYFEKKEGNTSVVVIRFTENTTTPAPAANATPEQAFITENLPGNAMGVAIKFIDGKAYSLTKYNADDTIKTLTDFLSDKVAIYDYLTTYVSKGITEFDEGKFDKERKSADQIDVDTVIAALKNTSADLITKMGPLKGDIVKLDGTTKTTLKVTFTFLGFEKVISIAGFTENPVVFTPHWDNPLPKQDKYETNTANVYTTDITQAKGYVAEVKPQAVTIPDPKQAGQTVVVDGQTFTAKSGTKKWNNPLPTTPVYETNTANTYTTDKTKGKGYKAEVTEKHPTIKGNPIDTLPGGQAYNASEWKYKVKTTGTVGTDEVTETKPKINNVVIDKSTGGDAYNSDLWTWKVSNSGSEGSAEVKEVKPTVKNVSISGATGGETYNPNEWKWAQTNAGTPGKDEVENVNVTVYGVNVNLPGGTGYDAGKWDWKKTTTGNAGKAATGEKQATYDGKDLGAGTGGSSYDVSKWTYTEETAATKDADGEYKALYNNVEITTVTVPKADTPVAPQNGTAPDGFDDTKFDGGSAATPETASTPDTYTATYNGVEITTKTKEVNYVSAGGAAGAKPTGAPDGFNESANYNLGTKAAAATNGTAATYTPSYKGTAITALDQKVNYTGSKLGDAPTGAPTNFVVGTDYKAGTKHEDAVPQVDKSFVAWYNGVEVPSFTKTMPWADTDPAAGDEPDGWKDTMYDKGTAYKAKDNGTPFVYEAFYHGVTSGILVTVENNGETKGIKPSDGVAPTDYKTGDYEAGVKHEDEKVPAQVTDFKIEDKNAGDKITIDTTEYVVEQGIAYPSLPSVTYETDTAGEYTTDVTKAKGYVAPNNPTPVLVPDGTKDGDKVTVDGITYTWIATDPDATTFAPQGNNVSPEFIYL